jgi:hypothetical protein
MVVGAQNSTIDAALETWRGASYHGGHVAARSGQQVEC